MSAAALYFWFLEEFIQRVSVPADCSQTHWCWLALHSCTVAKLLYANTFCTVLISALHCCTAFQGSATIVRGGSSIGALCIFMHSPRCNCAAAAAAGAIQRIATVQPDTQHPDADSAESCRCTICKYAPTTILPTWCPFYRVQVRSVIGIWERVFGIWQIVFGIWEGVFCI